MKEYKTPSICVLHADEMNVIATSDTVRYGDFGYDSQEEYYEAYGYPKY